MSWSTRKMNFLYLSHCKYAWSRCCESDCVSLSSLVCVCAHEFSREFNKSSHTEYFKLRPISALKKKNRISSLMTNVSEMKMIRYYIFFGLVCFTLSFILPSLSIYRMKVILDQFLYSPKHNAYIAISIASIVSDHFAISFRHSLFIWRGEKIFFSKLR